MRYNFIICVIKFELLILEDCIVIKHMGFGMKESQVEVGSAANY